MAAVPSRVRADRAAPEADLTHALYERHAAQIFRYCLRQLGAREEAEDALQSTFLNAFRGIKRGVVPEQESAWLFKIAQNVCLSRRRSTWRRGRIESPVDLQLVEELAPAPARPADELVGLQDVLGRMPDNQRRAILLREWQGLSYREIAAELELSQTAVEMLIFRARRSLAKGLEAPPPRRRLLRGADLGNVLTALKSLLLGGGAAAAKVAAVVTVVGAGTVVATGPVHRRHPPVPAPPATKPARASTVRARPVSVRPAPRPHVVAITPVTTRHVSHESRPARREDGRPQARALGKEGVPARHAGEHAASGHHPGRGHGRRGHGRGSGVEHRDANGHGRGNARGRDR